MKVAMQNIEGSYTDFRMALSVVQNRSTSADVECRPKEARTSGGR